MEGPSPSLHTLLKPHSVPLKHTSQPDTEQYFFAVSFKVQCRYLKQLKNMSLKKILKDAGNPSLGSNNFCCFQLVLLPILLLSQLHHYTWRLFTISWKTFFFPHNKAALYFPAVFHQPVWSSPASSGKRIEHYFTYSYTHFLPPLFAS